MQNPRHWFRNPWDSPKKILVWLIATMIAISFLGTFLTAIVILGLFWFVWRGSKGSHF